MMKVLVTGASGAVGTALLHELADTELAVVATDLHAPDVTAGNITFVRLDVTGNAAMQVITGQKPDVVVHLASIVTPATRAFSYKVDVEGSGNIFDAAVKNGVRRIVVTSSGAAYGYHADNPVPLVEQDELRGNYEFPYSDHNRQVEEKLARLRKSNPELEQVVLRVGTVLGAGLENQITALFRRKRLLAVGRSESPFVFIWTRDLARIIKRAITDGPPGIFNAAGDGTLGVSDFSRLLEKPVLRIPAWLLKVALAVAKPLGLSRYGPEQVRFLQYRPVLDNTALKQDFGYTPELTSEQVFDLWRREAGL